MVIETLLWVKAFHLFAVMAWMAGLFYLPRLLVYHAMEPVGSDTSMIFKIMERRLLKAIMRPALVSVVLSGALLWWGFGYSITEVWLAIKLVAVIGLIAVHGFLEKDVVQFARDARHRSSRFYRVVNEIPTLLLAVILIMVVVRPFA